MTNDERKNSSHLRFSLVVRRWSFVPRLQADLTSVLSTAWTDHDNRLIYTGEWSGLALRNASGNPTDLVADSVKQATFTDTPLLVHCPYIQDVLATFDCPLGSVRFLKLAAGAEIDEHVDGGLCNDWLREIFLNPSL